MRLVVAVLVAEVPVRLVGRRWHQAGSSDFRNWYFPEFHGFDGRGKVYDGSEEAEEDHEIGKHTYQPYQSDVYQPHSLWWVHILGVGRPYSRLEREGL